MSTSAGAVTAEATGAPSITEVVHIGREAVVVVMDLVLGDLRFEVLQGDTSTRGRLHHGSAVGDRGPVAVHPRVLDALRAGALRLREGRLS